MIRKKSRRGGAEVNSSSMADIAFLLLIFFLVTTKMAQDKGILAILPPEKDPNAEVAEVTKRNLMRIVINSKGGVIMRDKVITDKSKISDELLSFMKNPDQNPNYAMAVEEAIIILKNDRGTLHKDFIKVQDEIEEAYNTLRAESVGLTVPQYLKLDKDKDKQRELFKESVRLVPKKFIKADPTAVGG